MRLDDSGTAHRPVTIDAVIVPVPTNPNTLPSSVSILAGPSVRPDI
jgi:hypothetical protein